MPTINIYTQCTEPVKFYHFVRVSLEATLVQKKICLALAII